MLESSSLVSRLLDTIKHPQARASPWRNLHIIYPLFWLGSATEL